MAPTARRMTVVQAAARVGLHPQTIRRYIRKGLLRTFQSPSPSKFGRRHRILEADLEKFIARHLGPVRIPAPPIEGVANPAPDTPNPAR